MIGTYRKLVGKTIGTRGTRLTVILVVAMVAAGFTVRSTRPRDASGGSIGVRGSPTYVFEGGRAVLYVNFPFSVLHAVAEVLVEGLQVGGSAC